MERKQTPGLGSPVKSKYRSKYITMKPQNITVKETQLYACYKSHNRNIRLWKAEIKINEKIGHANTNEKKTGLFM